jgi:branched-chain amino acid transport system substrate-binding protein
MKRETWIGIVILVVVVLGGWYALSRNGGLEEGPVKVGVILPLTGDSSKYGEPAQRVMQIALDEVNALGGVDGNPIELIFEDGKCTGAGATSALQKLINVDGVEVVIGGFCSGESVAIVPVATEAKVALISPGSTSPKLTDVSKYFVRNYPSASSQGKSLAEVAYNDKAWKKVAFIQEQTDYAAGVFMAFSDTFTALGGTVTKEEFPTDTTDFRSIITKAKNAGADALFIDVQAAPAADRILTQVTELGWKPNLIVSNIVVGDPEILKNKTAMLEGTLSAEYRADLTNPKFAKLLEVYKGKYGEDLSYQSYAQAEYDAIYLVRDAVSAAGYDGTRIANWFRTSVKDWPGASGGVTILPNGDPAAGFQPVVVENGKPVLYAR